MSGQAGKVFRDGETPCEILPESKIVAEIVSDAETRRNLAKEKKRADDRERMRRLLADPEKRAEIMRRKAERRAADASIRGREYAKRKEERAARAEPRKKAAEIQAAFDAELERMRARRAGKKKPVWELPLFVFAASEKCRVRFVTKYAESEEFRARQLARGKAYKEAHPEMVKKWNSNPETKAKAKAMRSTPEAKEAQKQWAKEYRKKKPHMRVISNIRIRMRQIVKECKHGSNSMRTRAAIGCSASFLRLHIESMFKPGMSWINYGDWHVDHLIPLSFAKGDAGVAQSLNHWTNLRPEWAQANMAKGGSMDYCKGLRSLQ